MIQAIKRGIPNTITSCNLISGGIATVFALQGNAQLALLWIVIGAVFDFFDGMSARLLHVSSPIGKELDSLADDITFGLAPSAILFTELHQVSFPSVLAPVSAYLPYLAFVMAAFSALRLANFNLDARQTMGFIGLPTPANALFWGSVVIGFGGWLECWTYGGLFLLAMIGVSCWLLIAEIPMFALKFKQWGWAGNRVKYIFVLSSAVLLIAFRVQGIALVIAWYIVLSIGCNVVGKAK